MIRASVSHAKGRLSALLGQVKACETIVITDREGPIARIVPIESSSWGARFDDLARMGLVRLPIGEPLVEGDIVPIALEKGGHAGVLDAVIEERGEGR